MKIVYKETPRKGYHIAKIRASDAKKKKKQNHLNKVNIRNLQQSEHLKRALLERVIFESL